MTSRIVHDDVRAIVESVGASFHGLSGKRLLVTGGTGFLGSYLLETVAYLNDFVLSEPCVLSIVTRDASRAAARLPHLCRRGEFTLLEGDVRAFRAGSRRWDYVVHGAASADASVFLQDPAEIMDIIASGTRVILAETGADCDSFLCVSSGAVYGHQPGTCSAVAEDHTGGPDLRRWRSCYAEAKRYAEVLCQVFHEKLKVPVTIARVFALLGPYQDGHATSAVVDFIRQGLSGDTIRIRDAGDTQRAYCYIADAVAGLFTLLLRPHPGEVFNIGSAEAVSFVDLAHRVSRCLGKRLSILVDGNPAAGILGARYVPDVARLSVAEGFRPSTDLDEALRRTIAWMQEREERRPS